jgi:hypothetical protein
MSCPICNNELKRAFTARVLHKYDSSFECCRECGFIRASEPHWLNEAYSSAIAAADTGLIQRNLAIAGKLSLVLYLTLQERGKGRYLDAAGGYGILTRLMRDLGFDFYWSDKYCPNLLARGFEYDKEVGACVAVSAMEVLEHLIDPLAFIDGILSTSRADTLFFSTELYSGRPPDPTEWWYYSFSTGQHIGFFQYKTLQRLAQELGLYFTSANGLHAFSRQKITPYAYKLATNPLISRIGSQIVRKKIGSRTMTDYIKITNAND